MNILSIDIGGTYIRSVIINSKLNIINLIKNKSSNNMINDIVNHFNNQIKYSKKNNITLENRMGISIGGCIDKLNGAILNVSKQNNKWISPLDDISTKSISSLNLKEELNKNIKNFDIYIDNDGNCAAYSEKYFGNAINCNNFITIVLGTGVGIGVYINGQIIQYAEIGDFIEDKCSGRYFDSFGKKITKKNYIDGAKCLGKKTSELIHLLNPEKVIFNGTLLKIGDFFINIIKESIVKNTREFFLNKCEIIFSKLENQGLLGAYSLAIF